MISLLFFNSFTLLPCLSNRWNYFFIFIEKVNFWLVLTFFFFWHLPDELLHFDLFLNARVGDIYNPETTQLMDQNRKLKFCLKREEQ